MLIIRFTFLFLAFSSLAISFADAAGKDVEKTPDKATSHTEHPPHDHHHDDHGKKLNEGSSRRKNKKSS